MTYCDAENSIKDGSYKSLGEDVLQDFIAVCLNTSGINQNNVQRIRSYADIFRRELDQRNALRQFHASTPTAWEPVATLADSNASNRNSEDTWDESKLLGIIQNQIEESLEMEYKAAGALSRDKFPEITKDVSAMANSAGGVLIYGMREYKEESKRHLPERLDPVNRREYSKESLEHVIAQIRPRISDLRIHPVQLSSGQDDVAYVVEIPKGSTAHQASDYRYYRRHNFEAVRMFDHEIRDVMNRAKHPLVVVSAQLVIFPRPNNDGAQGSLIFNIHNKSDVFARYVVLVASAPMRIKNNLIDYGESTLEHTDEGAAYKLVFSNHSGVPLFPRAQVRAMFKFKLFSGMSRKPEKFAENYRFSVCADSMPMVRGSFTFDQIVEYHDGAI